MHQLCKICGQQTNWTEQDLSLFKKLDVPISDICPDCRHKTKMAFRNERSLYKRVCDLCEKEMISMFNPASPYTVYCNKCWWSDKWDPLNYAQDFNFNKPFFDQFDSLLKKVPRCAIDNFDQENSDYCNYASRLKDCYMLFGSWHNEKCFYGNTVLQCLETNDSLYTNKCRHGFELIDCEECYELFCAQNCMFCSNSYFLYDCKNCQNCALCWNLRNKQLHILNRPVSKEEFSAKTKEFLGSYKSFKEAFEKFRELVEKEAIHKFMEGEKNENSTGNLLWRCKNTNDVFYGIEAEDLAHSVRTAKDQKDSMFINGNSCGELMYDSIHCDYCHNGKFSLACEHVSDFTYSMTCYQCEYIFGCIGLRHKKYCVLNKRYSKEEYENLMPKIIEHMKKTDEYSYYFPMSISPFAYNETVAQEYYPLTKEKALSLGAKWLDEDRKELKQPTVEIPDNIVDTDEKICNEILQCETCGKNYKIIKQELVFYKKYNLPIPHKCFACRHMERLSLRAPYRLFERTCTKCGKSLESSYSPNRLEKVYCEDCYLKEVY